MTARFEMIMHTHSEHDEEGLTRPEVILAALKKVGYHQRVIHMEVHEFPHRLFQETIVQIYVENVTGN